MSADSPRRGINSRCVPAVVPPQVVSDRSILDSAIGFINDVTLSHQPHSNPKDLITWARFESMADISDPRFGEDWELEGNVAPPLLLVLGYGLGVQVWAIPANGEAIEVLSWRHGSVSALRVLPTPAACTEDAGCRADELTDAYAEKRPLMALCEGGGCNSKLGGGSGGGGPQPQFCAVNFVSLKTGAQVRTIKFKNPVLDILANRTSIAITFHERIAVFDARTLDDRLSITSCYPSPGINPNPVALGSRWLAYAEHKLLHSKRSGGGCDGDGVASYTATVLNAAKSFGKGLRELGEQVAAGLTGGATSGGSGSNSKSSSFDSSSSGDMRQPGIVTIMDIKHPIKDVSPTSGAPISTTGSDPFVAHFIAHTEALVAMEFDNSGMLLVTADKRGHDFHVFRIQPHPVGSSLAAVHHLYVLHRGDTTAKVQNIVFSLDSRWVAVSTLRGTTHVFPITPYGGAMGVRTHTSLHVVNKLSRFHRSAGLSAEGRSSSPISHSESTTFSQSLMPYHNPTLPPYTRPTVVQPLAQLRQPFALGSPPGSAVPLSKLSGSASSSSACSQRQRLSSLSDDNGKPLSVCAIFAKSRSWLLDPPNATREAPHRMQRKAVDSLFVMAGHGALIQYDLDTRLASNVAKEKICDETPIELEVEAKAQWSLGRKDASQEIMPPLFADNWLIKDRSSCVLTDSTRQFDDIDDRADSWLSQVEIITHAGPHRRLWMGPQFVFKTYNTPTGSNLNHIEAEAVEIGVSSAVSAAAGGARAERSSPLNMPLSAAGRSGVPVLIESGSYSSIEQSPKLMDRFRHEHLDSDFAVAHGDTRLKEDLADAMRESPSVSKNSKPSAEFLMNDASSENGPFFDALADHDDDHAASSQERHSAATSALAHALPNLYSYAAYDSQATPPTTPRPSSSIEKVVNPLGTVTTIMAGLTSELSTDILDEVVSQLAAEETVIHENCDEALFRPVVAIFCDEKSRVQQDEARKQLQDLCKPPEEIGTKFIVPVIEKERDEELCKKEKQKSGLARARGRKAKAEKADELAELERVNKKLPIPGDAPTPASREATSKGNRKTKTENEIKPKENDTISDTNPEMKTEKNVAEPQSGKKADNNRKNRKSEEKSESENTKKPPEIKTKADESREIQVDIRKTEELSKTNENRTEKTHLEKLPAEKKDEKKQDKTSQRLEDKSQKKPMKKGENKKGGKISSQGAEKIEDSVNQTLAKVEVTRQEIQGDEINEKKSTDDVSEGAAGFLITNKYDANTNKESDEFTDKKIQKKEKVISKDFVKEKSHMDEYTESKEHNVQGEKLSVAPQEENLKEIKRMSSPAEEITTPTDGKVQQSEYKKSAEPVKIGLKAKPKSVEKNIPQTLRKYAEAASASRKAPHPAAKELEEKAAVSEKLSSENPLEESRKTQEITTDQLPSGDEVDNPQVIENLKAKTTLLEPLPFELVTKNAKTTTKKKKQKSNKSMSNSEVDTIVQTDDKVNRDSKEVKTVIENKSCAIGDDSFAAGISKTNPTIEQTFYSSCSDLMAKEPELRAETEESLNIQGTRNSEENSTSSESNTPESVKEIETEPLKTKVQKENQEVEDSVKKCEEAPTRNEATKPQIEMAPHKATSSKNDLMKSKQIKDLRSQSDSTSAKNKSDEAAETSGTAKEKKDKQKSPENQLQQDKKFGSGSAETLSEMATKVDSGKYSTAEDKKKDRDSKGAIKKELTKKGNVTEGNRNASDKKRVMGTAQLENPIAEDAKKAIRLEEPLKEPKIKTKESMDDNTAAGIKKQECKTIVAATESGTVETKKAKKPNPEAKTHFGIEVAITEQPKRSKPDELNTEITGITAKDTKIKARKSRKSTSDKPGSGTSSNEDAPDPLQSQKTVEENLLIFENSSPQNEKLSNNENPMIKATMEIAKPLSAWQTLSGAAMINQQLIGGSPTAEVEVITSKPNRKQKKPMLTADFAEFPSLKPLEPLPPFDPLPPLSIGEPFLSEGEAKSNPNQESSPVSLMTFESPQLESPVLAGPRITPPPRGFTEQNLILALCGSLHYENENENMRSSNSTVVPKSTVDYKSLIDHVSDGQYLSLEQSSQEGKPRPTEAEKSSSTSNTSSASSEEIGSVVGADNRKMSKKQQKHKKLGLDLLKQKEKQSSKGRTIDADDGDCDADDDDEELQPLISLCDSKQDMDTASNEPLLTFPGAMTFYSNRCEGGGGGATTDSEGPMPATTTSDDNNTAAYQAYRSGGSLNSSSGTKLKTKKLEHKINLIAAIEAATSSSTSSAEEESGVEAGAASAAMAVGGLTSVTTDSAAINSATSNIATATLSNIQYPPVAAQQSASKKKTKRRKR